MTNHSAFTFTDLTPWNELRRQSVLAWWGENLRDLPDGWSLSKTDPAQLLSCFSELKLMPGVRLWACQFKEGDSGNGFVLALRQGIDPMTYLPGPKGPPPVSPVPVMSVLQGTGTPQSYFEAALFSRECKELGAMGHGIDWLDRHLLTNKCWEKSSDPVIGYNYEPITPGEHSWRWHRQRPSQFDPSLEIGGANSNPVLTFYTYHGRDEPMITRHIDVFHIDGYSFHSQEEIIAAVV